MINPPGAYHNRGVNENFTPGFSDGMGWDVGLWDSCGEIFSQIFTLLELE